MPKAKISKLKKGALDIASIRGIINKKAGREVAHSLQDSNPTEVNEWIPTGSRWLDAIICKGKAAGIPVGKISEIAGLPGTGKSFLAAQIAGAERRITRGTGLALDALALFPVLRPQQGI